MRTVTYGAACSLDGFLTGPAGEIDWIHFSDDVQKSMAAMWASVDAILMGRKTWDFAVSHAPPSGSADAGPPAAEAAGPTTYVFSRTLKEITTPGAELVSSDAGDFVRELKRRPGRDIFLMGGGDLARSLFEAGVVDKVELSIHPLLLGSGAPLFRDAGRRVGLELVESRTIDGGCVLASYRVTESS